MANTKLLEEDDKTQLLSSQSINTLPINLSPSSADDLDATMLDVKTLDVFENNQTNSSNDNPISRIDIGYVLKNRFEIIANLGEGGMGMVFKAIDRRKVEAKSRNPYIAIKVLNPSLARNEILVAGLQRECEKVQALSHPNIITVYDFDRDGDNVFMSMEFLEGQTLNQMIKDHAPAGGIKIPIALRLIRHMGKALAYAHRNNIVHSDFKPANVFITENNEVKVLDFGIAAKTQNDHDDDATIFDARTEGGHTPPYASFEMINGAKADPRDDIYALGLVIYEMLTGKHPYNRKSASAVFMEEKQTGKSLLPKPIKGLSKRQWQLLKSALEILQDKRPKDFSQWLEEFYPKPKKSSKLWPVAGLAGTVLIVVAGYFGYSALNSNPQTDLASPAKSPETNSPPPAPASLQSVIKLPLAQPGGNQQGTVGVPIQFNGRESQTGDGEILTYAWRLAKSPAGSLGVIQNSTAVNPQLVPDKAGDYIIELQVSDKHNQSAPALMTVTVDEAPQALQQLDNVETALSLTTSKMKYKIGELLQVYVHVVNTGYLRVAYVGANGEVSELLPNEQQATKVNANTDFVIPPKSAKFKLKITGPVGVDKIVAVYSQVPIINLEKIVSSNAEIADQYQQNMVIKKVAYDVVN
jgi:serine/threonine protein kinase